MNITIQNLVDPSVNVVQGQRVLQVSPGVWVPVGFGGDYVPQGLVSNSYMPSTQDQVIPAGKYLAGRQLIKGDQNLVAQNIKAGVSIFNVEGSYQLSNSGGVQVQAGYIDANGNFQPLSFDGTEASDSGSAVEGLTPAIFNTGHPEPDYGGSAPASSMDFYKCTSVDISNSTWSGRKAVLNEGVYSFQSSSTEGLSYSLIKPIVGYIYSEDALIKAWLYDNIPFQGLVLDAPLSAQAAYTADGRAITVQGTVNYSVDSDIPCMTCNNGCLTVTDSGIPSWNTPRSFSYWCNGQGSQHFGYGTNSTNKAFYFYFRGDDEVKLSSLNLYNAGVQLGSGGAYPQGWHHFVVAYSGASALLYMDGTLIDQETLSSANTTLSGTFYIGGYKQSSSVTYFQGKLAAFRVYNRVLTVPQIQALASQFTPTA